MHPFRPPPLLFLGGVCGSLQFGTVKILYQSYVTSVIHEMAQALRLCMQGRTSFLLCAFGSMSCETLSSTALLMITLLRILLIYTVSDSLACADRCALV